MKNIDILSVLRPQPWKLLLVIGFAVAAVAGAQEAGEVSLDVERAVAQALAQNLSLRGGALDVESARENKNKAFRVFYPQISLNGGVTFLNDSPSGNIAQNRFSADITAQLTLRGRVVSDLQVAILQYEAGKISYQQAAQELERSVRSLFYALLLLEGSTRIAAESVRIAEERAEDTQIRFDAGLFDEYTLLTAQVSVIDAQTPLDEMRKQYRDDIRRFNLLLGNRIDQPIKLVGQIEPQAFTLDAERVIAELVPVSPAIQGLEIAADLMRKDRAINTADFIPNLVFGYQFSQSYDKDIISDGGGFGDASNWTTGGGLSVTLSIPLSNLLPFSQTWVQQNILSRSVEKAEFALEERRKSVVIETRSLIDSLQLIEQNIRAKQLNVRRAERAFAVAEEGYQVGLRNILEVRDAQNQLDNARLNYLNKRFDYITTQINLASQLGVSVGLLQKYALPEIE